MRALQSITGGITALAAFPSTALHALSDGMFNAVTSIRCGILALSDPQKAISYRAGREFYLSYNAATRKGPNRKWNPKNTTGDEQIMKGWDTVVARARDLVRNSPNVAGALRKVVNNVVFKGINPQAQLMRGDGESNEASNRFVESQFKKWARAVKFQSKQKQVVRCLYSDGGVFVRCFPSRTLFKRGLVPLGIELLEVDHLDRNRDEELENGNVIMRGIEYTPDGFVDAYWLFPNHPGSSRPFMRLIYQSKRISADYCFLISDPERPSQSLPIPIIASVIMSMHNFAQYQDSEQIAARLAAAFCVFIKTTESGVAGNGLDGSPLQTMAPATDTTGASIPDFVSAGGVHELPPGKEIQLAANPRPGDNYSEFTKTSLRNASAGMGMSSQAFSNDYSDASYSSVRSSVLEERRSYQVLQQLIVDEMLHPLWELWVTMRYLFGLGSETEIPVTWQTPGWDWVDPLKDAAAYEKLLAMGVENEFDLAASRGRDYEDNLDKKARAKKLRIAKGLEPAKEAAPNA